MNGNTFIWAAVIAAIYIAWPLLGKWSGASGAWVSNIVIVGSLLSTVVLSARQLIHGPMLTAKALIVILIAGIANGCAVYFYSVKANDPTIPTGTFLMTVYILMVLFAPILDWMLNGATINMKQGCGVALAITAIYLLKK